MEYNNEDYELSSDEDIYNKGNLGINQRFNNNQKLFENNIYLKNTNEFNYIDRGNNNYNINLGKINKGFNENNFNTSIYDKNINESFKYNFILNENRNNEYALGNNLSNNYNNHLTRNLNNYYLEKDKFKFNNNLNLIQKKNNKFRELINTNNNHIFNNKNRRSQNNQLHQNFKKNVINMPYTINMRNNNFILNENIKLNHEINFTNNFNLINENEIPNQTIDNYNKINLNLNTGNKNRNNCNKLSERKNNMKKKNRIIENEIDEKNEDESFSKIADDLYNIFLKKNNEKNIQTEKQFPKDNFNNFKIIKDENKNNFISLKQPITKDKNKEVEKFNFQEKIEEDYKRDNNDLKNIIFTNNNFKRNELQKLKENLARKNTDKEYFNESTSFFNNMNNQQLKSFQENEEIFYKIKNYYKNEDSKYTSNNEINFINKKGEVGILDLSKEYLESKEEEKVKKVRFDLDKNIYFNYLKDDKMDICQVKKGRNGGFEYFEKKNNEDNFNSNIISIQKSCIRPFVKEDIKINENYLSCEYMEESQIIPELFNGDDLNLNLYDLNDLDGFFDLNFNDNMDDELSLSQDSFVDGSTDFTTISNNNSNN